jgi:UDP-3-O-[3-hydroxymyristoyl] glucosamine N-acyltransferase
MNKVISSNNVIGFLKLNKLYAGDNHIENVANYVSNLEESSDQSIIFIKKINYDLSLIKSKIIIVPKSFKEHSKEKTIIYSPNPQLAMAYIIKKFFLKKGLKSISKTAIIDQSVKLGKNIEIGENVHIGENCIVGDNTKIHSNCVIHPNTIIGNNVILLSGANIGQIGFGFIKDLDGSYINFPHIGKVIINDNVEIGANTCIDRGVLSITSIGENTKIHSLCHIAHNVQIGKNCLIAAKSGICGSTVIGDNVYIGHNASILNGIIIQDNVVIGMGAIVRKGVQEGYTIVPFESYEINKYSKLISFLRKIIRQKS